MGDDGRDGTGVRANSSKGSDFFLLCLRLAECSSCEGGRGGCVVPEESCEVDEAMLYALLCDNVVNTSDGFKSQWRLHSAVTTHGQSLTWSPDVWGAVKARETTEEKHGRKCDEA